jgi:G3E family GTPase
MTFIGGYLGAGKTTAINELLAHTDRPIAVIVNDVGSINIDAALIRKRHGDTIELTDGCICCSSLDGMGAALDQIRARPEPPDHVVVELSGVAEPARMLPWGQSAGFVLDGVVVVVAADQLSSDSLPPLVQGYIRAHITSADLLILTKTDLVEATSISSARIALAELAPNVPVLDGGLTLSMPGAIGRFLALGGRRPGGPTSLPDATLFDLHEVRSVSPPPLCTLTELHMWLRALPEFANGSVVRAKGVLATTDAGPVLLQAVGRRVEISPISIAEQHPATDVVVISLRSNSA